MKKIKLLTGLSTLSVIGVGAVALTSCHDPKEVSMTLVWNDETEAYIPKDCEGSTETKLKTITLNANVRYTFKINVDNEHAVDWFIVAINSESGPDFFDFSDCQDSIKVTRDGIDITKNGKYYDGGWFLYDGGSSFKNAAIEFSIILKTKVECVPSLANS